MSGRHRVMVVNDVLIFHPERIRAAMFEYAHRHGADWLVMSHLLQVYQTHERERQERRFPSVNYFRHLVRRNFQKRPQHATH